MFPKNRTRDPTSPPPLPPIRNGCYSNHSISTTTSGLYLQLRVVRPNGYSLVAFSECYAGTCTVGLKWNFVRVALNLRLRVLAFANAWARICKSPATLRAKFALNLRTANSTQMRWMNLIGWHIRMRNGRWSTKKLAWLYKWNRVCLFINT